MYSTNGTGITGHSRSVLYIVIPVAIAQAWRSYLLKRGAAALAAAMDRIGPWSIGSVLATLVLLFAFQGEEILQQPRVIALLAVAAAISLFGFHSGAALATVVGVLIEVPAMLLVVSVVNRSKGWYEHTGHPVAVKS